MASKRIQGITIEIGGDTGPLQKALKGIDAQLSKTQGNLKDINKLLKLDPGNTELLVQKQKNLQSSIKATEDRLKELKKARDESTASDEQYEAWVEWNNKIQKSIDATAKEAQKLSEQLKKTAKDEPEYESLTLELSEVEKKLKDLRQEQTETRREFGNPMSTEQYDDLQREIIETEQHLEGLQDEYKAFGSVAKQKIAAAGQAMQDMGGKISEAGRKMQEIGGIVPGELKKIGSAINEHVLQPMMQVVKVVGAAGIGLTTALTKGAVDAASEYEQLSGGIVKLYGDAAGKVAKNAQKAYKTAGQSANDYMKTVTSFSASLISSLGGNTQKAARIADQAIRDMSDNANTFGSDFETIQNVYQALAKEQYNTLDNLSLGYAGTKAGMEQLIRDAERMDSTFKVTHKTVKKGKEVNDELAYSYADVIQAIHIVQDNMHIAGTTTNEASKTIEGSLNAMKASWQNLLTAIGTGEDVKGATRNVLSTAGTYLKDNLLPTIRTALSNITTVADEVWAWLAPQLPEIKRRAVNWLNEQLPKIPGEIAEALGKAFQLIRLAISGAIAVMSAQLSYWITGDYSLAGKFRNSFLEAKKDIEEALRKIGAALSRLWNETLKPYLGDKLKTFITKTLPKLTGIIGKIADKISGLIDRFNNLDPEIKNTILDVGLAIIAGSLAVSGIGKVITAGGDLISKLGAVGLAITGPGGLTSILQTLKTALSNPIVGVAAAIIAVGALAVVHWDDIKKLWDEGTAWIKDKVDWLKQAIPNAWRSLWNALPEPVKNAVRIIRDWLSKMIDKINTALNKLDKFIRKNQQTADTDPSKARTGDAHSYYNDYGEGNIAVPSFFAKGGTLNEGQSAIVGELAPEYLRVINGRAIVTPMTNQPGRLGGDTTVNITINPQPGQSAEDIAAAVKRVFTREMQQREAAYA